MSLTSYFKYVLKRNYGIIPNEPLVFSEKFKKLIAEQNYRFENWFDDKPLLIDNNGKPDYLGTCFYMLISLQEYDAKHLDKFHRFKYKESYQYAYKCEKENLVETYLREYFKAIGQNLPKQRSKVFISHDIDLLYGGLRQDLHILWKRKRLPEILKKIFKYVAGQRTWKNIDKIMQIETEADVKATFFWIVQNQYHSYHKIRNGDYTLQDEYVIKMQRKIDESPSFENGLHKSTSDNTDFNEECNAFPYENILINRNHYLKFNLPAHYTALDKSRLKIDSSLGFHETIGYRNSYGLPFRPYHLEERRMYNLLEVPLHIMDTSFLTYQHKTAPEIEQEIIDFIDAAAYNNVISILWHNDKLIDLNFDKMLEIFKKVLILIKESKLETILPTELYEQYY